MSSAEEDRLIALLTKRFAAFGARDAESWARSQVKEGIPQLHRYLFLRQAWRAIIADDPRWLDGARSARPRDPTAPGAALSPALGRILAAGARPEDVTTVVRCMQWELLHQFCYLLDDPMLEPEARDVAWALFAIDPESGAPIASVGGLHESVLETEPGGTEMRPRDNERG